ncbi:13061_t:CDS:10 [Ambispora gerdemannii]|uniref:13061_t:CDS:1 n=1 Tax=Ambispora gerdemannii TaxID=144530 RepID=A0A9N8UXE5_9GLOM|nr:13061_t:CDS:10 [Ambispora gerdemannii]
MADDDYKFTLEELDNMKRNELRRLSRMHNLGVGNETNESIIESLKPYATDYIDEYQESNNSNSSTVATPIAATPIAPTPIAQTPPPLSSQQQQPPIFAPNPSLRGGATKASGKKRARYESPSLDEGIISEWNIDTEITRWLIDINMEDLVTKFVENGLTEDWNLIEQLQPAHMMAMGFSIAKSIQLENRIKEHFKKNQISTNDRLNSLEDMLTQSQNTMNEFQSRLTLEIDEKFAQLHAKIDKNYAQINTQLDEQFTQFNTKFESLENTMSKLDQSVGRLENEISSVVVANQRPRIMLSYDEVEMIAMRTVNHWKKEIFYCRFKATNTERQDNLWTYDDVLFCAETEHAVKPPMGSSLAVKFAQYIDPGFTAERIFEEIRPWVGSWVMCGMNVVKVWRAERDEKQTSHKNILLSEDSSSPLLPVGPWVYYGKHHLEEDINLILPEHKFSSAQRRTYFTNPEIRKSHVFDPEHIYAFDFFNNFTDLSTMTAICTLLLFSPNIILGEEIREGVTNEKVNSREELVSMCTDSLTWEDLTPIIKSKPNLAENIQSESSSQQNSLTNFSADELYQRALNILNSLKPISPKPSQSITENDDVDASILPFSLRLLGKIFISLFSKSKNLQQSVNGEIPKKYEIEPKNEKLELGIAMLKKAGLDLGHDDALYSLADINFHAKYSHRRNLTAAFEYYKILATRSGNATAQQMVGFMYATGIGEKIQRDQAQSLIYHTFAAHGGDTASQMTLAYRYLMGIGVPRSCEDAIYHYKQVADKAVEYYKSGPPGGRQLPPSKIRLYEEDGGVYGYGASGLTSLSRGDSAAWDDILEYYRYMAEHRDQHAQASGGWTPGAAPLILGQLFYQGTRNIPQNFDQALRYLNLVAFQYNWPNDISKIDEQTLNSQAAQAASAAAGILGQMYWRAEGVMQNNATALLWFTKGATLGNPVAQNGLGLMYLHGLSDKNGELLSKNRKEAERYFKMAAEAKNPDAQVNLGLYLYNKREYENAYQYFHTAAQSANFLAHYYLAEMHAKGEGTRKSCSLASAYYKMVAEKGDWLHSPFQAAREAYQSGDKDGALLNYLIAAERGYEIGQANVAWLLDRDKARWQLPHVTPKPDPDREKLALIYWTRSANQGNVDSRLKMGDYYFKGFGTDVDYEKAAACYQVAAEFESSSMAMWNLGWMHENGIGVSRDFHLAKRWYDQSLSTNQEAYLPVTLSLLKLYSRSFWNYITGGDDGDEVDTASTSKGLWWESIASRKISDEKKSDTTSLTKDGTGGGDTGSGGSSKQERHDWGIGPNEDQLWKNFHARKKSEDFTDSTIDEGYEDEEIQDDLMESLMILVICLLIGNAVGGIGVGGDWPPQGLLDDDNIGRFAWAGAGGH